MKRTIPVLMLLIAGAASAQDVTSANRLLKECRAAIQLAEGDRRVDQFDVASCIGYVEGFRDGLFASKIAGHVICLPDNASTGQLTRVIVKHLENNPNQLHILKGAVAHFALQAAFPCRR